MGSGLPEIDRGPNLVRLYQVVIDQALQHILDRLGNDS